MTSKSTRRLCAPLLAGFMLAACVEDAGLPADENATIYRSAGRLQCEPGGLSSEASAQMLAHEGVVVTHSGCGVITDLVFPAVCGAGTPDIVLHEIRTSQLALAERIGYQRVETIRSSVNEPAYRWVDCETRTPLP